MPTALKKAKAKTVRTEDLVDLVRKAATKQGWCSAAESALEDQLGIRFKQGRLKSCGCCRDELPRMTVAGNSRKTIPTADVAKLARKLMRDYGGGYTRELQAITNALGVDMNEGLPHTTVTFTASVPAYALEGLGFDFNFPASDGNRNVLGSALRYHQGKLETVVAQ